MEKPSFRRIRNLLINVSISLLTIILLLALTEGATRTLPRLAGGRLRGSIIESFLERCSNRVTYPGRHFGVLLPETVYEPVKQPAGLLYVLKPGAKEFWEGMDIEINSRGMRDDEVSVEKPENTFRIAVLGDSVTFGFGVGADEAYPNALERKLNSAASGKRAEVLNFGVVGYSTRQELIQLESKVLDYSPDLIIFGHHLNDIFEIGSAFTPISPWLIFLDENSAFFNCFRSSARFDQPSYAEVYKKSSGSWKGYKRILQRVVGISKERKIPTVFVLLPVWENLNGNYEFKEAQRFLGDAISSMGLLSLNMAPGGDIEYEYEDDLEYRTKVNPQDFNHPNPKGHEKIADAIYDKLVEEKLLP